MNPLTNVKNIKKLSEQELKSGNVVSSWHNQYKDSAWIFIGGLPYDLTEGDVLCIFSEYGEIVNINLVRDKGTGKQKGFCFICYEDQRSTILAVDNLNGIKVLGRTIRVDHVADYKPPKESSKADKELSKLQREGCAPVLVVPTEVKQEEEAEEGERKQKEKERKRKKKEKKKKRKKDKSSKKSKKSKRDRSSSESASSSSDSETD
ncbi:RNA-binding motif protein, X-linked 2-like [Homalodisca vitripennis]|uniref:RNA-binding motif protein, X-linked 2-like n=1 Tax=Homalodisca vitripennis TaxID=197043 RepID=UPI001EEBAB69|nr:RNA-binding motif protein, X-linked 2-like [Homalodisca vitripennis]